MAAEQIGFAIFDQHLAFLDLRPAGPQALDFPALQRKTGFIVLLDKVIVERLFVPDDGVVGGLFLAHECIIRQPSGCQEF